MKNLVLSTVFLLAGAAAVAQNPKVIDDPHAQQRTVGDFHGIQIGGGFELYLTQSDQEAVAVSASDREYRDRIVTALSAAAASREEWRFWGVQLPIALCVAAGLCGAAGLRNLRRLRRSADRSAAFAGSL